MGKQPIKTIDGIPFYSEDRYWGKAPKGELETAVKFLENKGWEAFRKVFGHKFDQTFEENRADFRFVIPLPKDFKALDAGAGMGRISIPLARAAGHVTALDGSFLRLKYLKKRAEHEEIKNIDFVLGDIFDASFEKESFDLIVMNGLLEWVGVTDRFQNPRDAQVAALKLCRDILKRGGYLYIGIENRLALSYMRGPDHLGLYFTSYMPRFLANWYTKIRQKRKYDTYTYTKAGYEKLLGEAGFVNNEFYLPYPGYNLPRMMIPYNNLDALAFAISSLMPSKGKKKFIASLIVKNRVLLWLYRYFFFSYGIVIKK